MSLDFDRSPDGEPTAAAGQTPVPAPATTGPAQPIGPSFTPGPVPADAEPADSEPADSEPAAAEHAADIPTVDETAADEPGPTTGERTDDEPEPGTYYPTTYERAAGEPAATDAAADEPAADEPAVDEPAADEPAATEASADEPTASELTAYGSGAAPAWDARRDGVPGDTGVAAESSADRAAGIGPTADLDGPLISDADELRTSWQRIQAAFVDDPRDAVADAAGLVEHTAQALTAALRQRQQQLRAMWDRDGMPDGVEYADSGGTAPRAMSPDEGRQAADDPDTEQLRLLVRRYRALFDHLCRP